MKKYSISAVILTHPGAERLTKCIKSVTWCDEIILVVDATDSGQRSVVSDKLKGIKVKIIYRRLGGDFSAQRNFGLEKANGEWVLFIDSDEVVSNKLANEIKKVIRIPIEIEYQGYYIKRRDYFMGKWLNYGETANIKLLRLARKNKGKWYGKVHEVWKVDGKTGYLENPILHYSHSTVANFLKKINLYSDFLSEVWFRKGRKISGWEIVFYPLFKFISNYFLKLGFLDGASGFIMAMMMSFHSFLARSKLWLKNKNEDNR